MITSLLLLVLSNIYSLGWLDGCDWAAEREREIEKEREKNIWMMDDGWWWCGVDIDGYDWAAERDREGIGRATANSKSN